jgi:prepilin-type N-terminal cleavage/methylation domain-containing protein
MLRKAENRLLLCMDCFSCQTDRKRNHRDYKAKESGVTLVELIITMVIASMAMGFLFSVYTLIVKIWNEYSCKTDVYESAWVIYNTIEQNMNESYDIKKTDSSQWHFYKNRNDSTVITHANGSLILTGSKKRVFHCVDSFYFEIENLDGEFPVWKCLFIHSLKKKQARISWRTFCRAECRYNSFFDEMKARINNSTPIVNNNLYWDIKNQHE